MVVLLINTLVRKEILRGVFRFFLDLGEMQASMQIMKRLLHIVASPREEESRTLQISNTFIEAFQQSNPDWIVDECNLMNENLPDLSQKSVSGKYVLLGGQDLFGSLKESWQEILQQIDRFKNADFFVVSAPMWNFGIPYVLKHYIDLIVQPQYLFRYTEQGHVEGLVKDKRMVIVTSRGGQYVGDTKHLDYHIPYLRTIFGFIGITDIEVIIAEGMDMGREIREKNIQEAKKKAFEIGLNA